MGFGLMREGGGTVQRLASRGAPEGRGAQWRRPVERVAAVLATEGGRRALGGPWAGVAGWAEYHLGRCGEKTKKKKWDGMQG
jgi:hypothetical protein